MKADPGKAAAIIAKTLEISPSEVQDQLPNVENPRLADLGDGLQESAVLAVLLCQR